MLLFFLHAISIIGVRANLGSRRMISEIKANYPIHEYRLPDLSLISAKIARISAEFDKNLPNFSRFKIRFKIRIIVNGRLALLAAKCCNLFIWPSICTVI